MFLVCFYPDLAIVHEVQQSTDIPGLDVPEDYDWVRCLGLLQNTSEGVTAGRQDNLRLRVIKLIIKENNCSYFKCTFVSCWG